MRKSCLDISDVVLLDKLECFIYEYSDLEYNNFKINLNYGLGNKEDYDKLEDIDNRYKLREMLSYYTTDTCLDEKKLENTIELFLLFLRTYDIEAVICLDALLDTIRKTGKAGNRWKCVKRVNGILASVYLLYFCSNAKLFDKENTEANMKRIFQRNIEFYNEEDWRFLTQIFINEKRYDCLIELLKADLKCIDESEVCDSQTERNMANNFFYILHKLKNSGKHYDAMDFCNESEYLFKIVADKNIRGEYEKEKARILFDLGKYEEAKAIQDKYINESGEAENIYDLYNGAIYYAWAAEYKEKDTPVWKEYIEKACKLIEKAERIILKMKECGKFPGDRFWGSVILEKSYLLSEKEDYDEAFRCFQEVFSKKDKSAKQDSNFSTHLWILMKYMCLHPDASETAIEWIDNLYSEFSHKRLKEYEVIVDFIHSNEYLKDKPELCMNIYKELLKLMFHALEIRHETKIRDLSQYDILYYTKAEHLRLLLEDEADEKCKYRLPMFHVYHMNDPQEGKILKQILGKNKLKVNNIVETMDSRKPYEENYIFLKSFFCYHKNNKKSAAKEFLPMWVQYGDDAKGCCVVLNNKSFENSSLRRIIYLTDEGECDNPQINDYLDKFKNTYQELVTLCENEIDLKSKLGNECVLQVESLIAYIVSQITYLFKHESYKHEQEVRLIVNRTNSEVDDIKVISGNVPKIYIYNDEQTYIDEIILGAKMNNPEDYVAFIYKQGNKMWGNNEQAQIKVTQSIIQYR